MPLVIRGEMAAPNGFVTIRPRRSEWHSSLSFSTFVGSSEWFQTLSIHEYRHLLQYDHMKQHTVKILMKLFGETGQGYAIGFGLPTWYFEGDAVWAETKYTDAGRGRSPEFLARLKALVVSNQLPSYDQFLNGTYRNNIPNQYIYGFVLISNATKKYGEDVWEKVTTEVSKLPHPLAFYHAFKKVTGIEFEDFFTETMNDLKLQWGADVEPNNKIQEYADIAYPKIINHNLYSARYNLDSQWAIYKNNERVVEIPFIRELSQLDFADQKAIFTQFLNDARNDYKGSSDLFLVNLENKKITKMTDGMRLYNPRFNHDQTKILAIDFERETNFWFLSEFDLNGVKLRSFNFLDKVVLQASAINDNEVVVILSEITGYKSIAKINLQTKEITYLVSPSRNNFSHVVVDSNKNVLFSSQFDGHVDIFKMDSNGNNFARCSKSRFMVFEPSLNGSELLYSDMNNNGSEIKKVSLNSCSTFLKSNLEKFNYLGKGASDKYNNFPLQAFDDQKELHTKNKEQYTPVAYGDFSRELFIPHSWSFIGGNGFDLSFKTDNYLRTMSFEGEFGQNPDEKTNFGRFTYSLKKWYPLINFNYQLRDRSIKPYLSTDKYKWSESLIGMSTLIPFKKNLGLYNFSLFVGGSFDLIKTKNNKIGSVYSTDKNRDLNEASVVIGTGFKKVPNFRSIHSPLGIDLTASYDNAKGSNNTLFNAHRFGQSFSATLPGFFANHGFKFGLNHQTQSESTKAYRFFNSLSLPTEYVLSRG